MTLYQELLDEVARHPLAHETITSAVVGPKWTAVRTKDYLGLAMSMNPWKAQRDLLNPVGLTLQQLSNHLNSWNFRSASLAMAAINCCLNQIADVNVRFASQVHPKSQSLLPNKQSDDLLVSVGDFPFLRQVDWPVIVLERDPDRGTHPDSAACEYIPKATILLLTGSTLINKTLPALLEMAKDSCQKILLGPSTPAAKCLLGKHALQRLGILCVREPDLVMQLAGLGAASEIFGRQCCDAVDLILE